MKEWVTPKTPQQLWDFPALHSACAKSLFGQRRLEILNALSSVTQGNSLIQTGPILSHMNSVCVCLCVFVRERGR